MMSLAAAILDFQIFKIFSKSNLNTENSAKTIFRGQHTSCVTYYDDIINRDVTYLGSKYILTNKAQLCQSFR